MNRKRILLTAVTVAAVAGSTVAAIGIASASVPPLVAANTTVVPSAPRIVAPPGMALNAGQTVTLAVGGHTFGDVTVPADATGVTVSITSLNPAAAGQLVAWTTDAGRPGTPNVTYAKGESATNVVTIGLNDAGKLNVYSSAKTKFAMALMAFNTPAPAPAPTCDATVASIPAATKTLTHVGGSIRTGATDFGHITLAAGTYDARVIGGWTGLNNLNNTVPDGVSLTGTMVVVKGDTINADFTNDVTAGGIAIPRSTSDTLTQDPTAAISTFLVLTESTEVHVQLFAYASNSGTAGSGEVKANVQSAQFRRVC